MNYKEKYLKYKKKYLDLKYQQNGGAKFIPYEDHALMKEEDRKANPIYCPDTHPFLCNNNTSCRRSKIDSNKNMLDERKPIEYK